MFKNGVKRQVKHPALIVFTMLAGVVVVYWLNLERTSFVSNAVYLFSVLVHEMFHSGATIMTGGTAHGFVVNAGSGGYAMISGGNPAIILPAGYVGCAIFGSAMLYLSSRYRWADLFASLVGVFIIGFTVAFGRPEENGSMTALNVAGGFGLLMLTLGLWGPLWLNMILVNIISTLTALQGLWGALALYQFSEQWHHNDAVMFSQSITPWMTGNQVALIWAAVSVILFGLAFYFGVLKSIFHGGTRQWNYIDAKTKMIIKE
jgi:hypothetical protein